ncbi:hypothetical protein [Georgenia sunbinii]|uniref:hypothetical protein n=1 Tax=Georgenia sunbinii TaxID=3117728 RepID=UPI002F269844
MDEWTATTEDTPGTGVTPERARALLASLPSRPRRQLGPTDHLSAGLTIVLALASGLLALSGRPWWATIPALAAIAMANAWLTGRIQRVNEPRLRTTILPTAVFTAWLLVPVWRGITRGETAPLPEAFILAGLAPVAWLVFYVILLIRR